ncbi:S-adenosylmethionine decarboxylase family protein [Ferruginibacter sp. SUN106]|uniref:S-adenosylmethionine decarboxylase family protein n=1 Tax=Ferruginibacter sp. SUN106 TaxID=2978348 RepID=UPI003D360228
MEYKPGKHLIATLQPGIAELIKHYAGFKDLINHLITEYQLVKLGEVYHNFSPEGFTAVICLSESHISIHTWPEHNLVNVDVYLSNFQKTNDNTVQAVFESITAYFDAVVLSVQTITR